MTDPAPAVRRGPAHRMRSRRTRAALLAGGAVVLTLVLVAALDPFGWRHHGASQGALPGGLVEPVPTTTGALPAVTLTLDGYGGYAVVKAADPVAGEQDTQAICTPRPAPAAGACRRTLRYHAGTTVDLLFQSPGGPWPNLMAATGPCNLHWDPSASRVPPEECRFTVSGDATITVTWGAVEITGTKVATWAYPACPVYAHPPRPAGAPCPG